MIQKEFIRNELRYRYPHLQDSIRTPEQPVGRPLLFERAAKNFGARIVICVADDFKTLQDTSPSDTLFLCIGTPDESHLIKYDICVLPAEEQASAVLNFIQRLFDRLDDWTQSLRQAAETGEGIEELLSRAGEILQNPVALLDERGHVIAQSDSMDIAIVAHKIHSDNMLEYLNSEDRVAMIGNRVEPEAIYVSLTSGEASYTLLCAASERPLYASDEIVLDSLAGFLKLMLSERASRFFVTQEHRENIKVSSAFRSLFTNDEQQPAAQTTLHELGWLDTDEYAILAIEPLNGDLRAAQANAICNLFESTFEGSCAFSLSPVIAAVIRTELLESDHLVLTLRSFAAENKLLIGICEPYAGFSLLQDRLKQAKLALDHAGAHDGVARFFDVMESDPANVLKLEFPKELLCLRSVLAMARYDRQHETNYVETAEQYVTNHFNAVKTAGELFIHRSTFLYRLERIKAQFGLDLDDRNISLLLLLLSFQIVKELR